jgi:hypothetical protein
MGTTDTTDAASTRRTRPFNPAERAYARRPPRQPRFRPGWGWHLVAGISSTTSALVTMGGCAAMGARGYTDYLAHGWHLAHWHARWLLAVLVAVFVINLVGAGLSDYATRRAAWKLANGRWVWVTHPAADQPESDNDAAAPIRYAKVVRDEPADDASFPQMSPGTVAALRRGVMAHWASQCTEPPRPVPVAERNLYRIPPAAAAYVLRAPTTLGRDVWFLRVVEDANLGDVYPRFVGQFLERSAMTKTVDGDGFTTVTTLDADAAVSAYLVLDAAGYKFVPYTTITESTEVTEPARRRP